MSLSKLKEMIKDVKVALFTTMDDKGRLRTLPMNTLDADALNSDAPELWFFTSIDTAGAANLSAQSPVSIAYADPVQRRYVSVSGTALISQNREQIRRLWRPAHRASFPSGMDDPSLALIQVRIEQAEYWDTPSSGTLNAFVVAKSLINGDADQAGERRVPDLVA